MFKRFAHVHTKTPRRTDVQLGECINSDKILFAVIRQPFALKVSKILLELSLEHKFNS